MPANFDLQICKDPMMNIMLFECGSFDWISSALSDSTLNRFIGFNIMLFAYKIANELPIVAASSAGMQVVE